MRLDNYLVQAGLVESRNKAQNIIKQGFVSVDGIIVTKSSTKIDNENIKIKEYKNYVSRAAWKLVAFLDEFKINIKDKNILDIGSSTGGFTQVLLEYDALHVSCVDVGCEQLHPSLQQNIQVSMYENQDIRTFDTDKQFDLITTDVSFISLLKIIDTIDLLSKDEILLLFKPQFEVGKMIKRDKNGVVVDLKAIQKAMTTFEDACSLKKWRLIVKAQSKLSGKEGNVEYFYYFKKM